MHEKQKLRTRSYQVNPAYNAQTFKAKDNADDKITTLPLSAFQGCMQCHTLVAPSALGRAAVIAHTSTQNKQSCGVGYKSTCT